MPRPRAIGIALVAAASTLSIVAVISEWREVSWWSTIRGLGVYPYQHFVDLAASELRIGWRGTAGFFNRFIPPAGLACDKTPPVEWQDRNLIPRILHVNQTHYLTIPLWPVVALTAAPGTFLLLRPRRRPGHCPLCGYDLAGLPHGPCPECGTLGNA